MNNCYYGERLNVGRLCPFVGPDMLPLYFQVISSYASVQIVYGGYFFVHFYSLACEDPQFHLCMLHLLFSHTTSFILTIVGLKFLLCRSSQMVQYTFFLFDAEGVLIIIQYNSSNRQTDITDSLCTYHAAEGQKGDFARKIT